MTESKKKKVAKGKPARKKTDTKEVAVKKYTSAEQALIDDYKNSTKDGLEALRFKSKVGEKNNVELSFDYDKVELLSPVIAKTTGTNQLIFGTHIIGKTVGATTSADKGEASIDSQANAVCTAMMDLSPRDGFEGMLVSQMVAVYNQAMECFRIANIDSNKSSTKIFSSLQNQGIKLMRTYTAQMEALKKYRTGGRQKMTVEHVHVHKGAQAIVGNVHQRGRGRK